MRCVAAARARRRSASAVGSGAIPDALVFTPERAKLRAEVIYSVIGIALLGPAMLWWKGVPWVWWPPCLGVAFAVACAQDIYALKIRGRDAVHVATEEIRVTNKRKTWRMGWQDIHRVYRFKEQLVFETAAPHRREILSLQGHDAHQRALFDAIAERARMLNLGWVESLAGLLG